MKVAGLIFAIFVFLGFFGKTSYAQNAVLTATVRANPLKVQITAPSTVTVGQWVNVSAQISNQGAVTITKTTAVLNSPSGISVRGKKKNVGDLLGGATVTETWMIKANSSGNFVIQVDVEGTFSGEKISASDTEIVSATGTLGFFIRKLILGV